MKKNIIILGAGNAQIDAIEYCRSMGHKVIGASYTTVDNGIPYLDVFENVDIKDVEGIVSIGKKHGADLIYSIGSDVAVPTVMRASKILGLPYFIEPEAADICHSKSRMRNALGSDFPGNLSFVECACLEDALSFSDFPGMMKPTDSQGQRGCFRVDSADDIREKFHSSMDHSNEGRVIIESFLEGREVSVNSYFVDGKMVFGLVSDRISFDEYPGGIIKEHLVPSSLSEDSQDQVLDLADRAAKRLGINQGPCYFQIKLDRSGFPGILEMAPRLDGCHMWNLIKHYCGADLLAACFEHLLGNVPEFGSSTGEGSYCLRFFTQPTCSTFEPDAHDTGDSVYSFYYYKKGDRVRKLNGYAEKCGYTIIKGGNER